MSILKHFTSRTAALLLATTTLYAPLAAGAAPLTASRVALVATERVSRTLYDYKFAVTFEAGASPVVNAIGHVASTATGSEVIDGDVSIGDVAPGARVTPRDTITIRHDITRAFNASALVWTFQLPPAGAVVKVSVAVADPGATNAMLSYRWRSTDGNIVDINAATTQWTLPPGPGLHFAYVLVGNGQGGFTERRVAVNTDATGGARVVPAPSPYSAPAAPMPTNGDLVTWLEGGFGSLPLLEPRSGGQVFHRAFAPDTLVYVQHSVTGTMLPAGGPASPARTDGRGRVIIRGANPIPDPDYYTYFCSRDGATWIECDTPLGYTSTPSFADYIGPNFPQSSYVVGRHRLADDSACGTKNEFFGTEVVGNATLINAAGGAIGGPVRMSTDGDFSFEQLSAAAAVRVTCQNGPVLSIPATPNDQFGNSLAGLKTTSGVRAPVVAGMSATLGTTAVGLFLPPPSGLPSDNVPTSEFFFGYKGVDTRRSACQYYKSVGAVQGCDAGGNFIGPINVEDWKRTVKIGAYATAGTPEYSATFVNQVDLNLTRNHRSISYGPNHTAASVCNHLGPAVDALQRSTQAQIDAAVNAAVAGKNLVACVMMDSIATPGVNGGAAYTRYLIFGPSGELLPSINLDGRREKFVPGVCVACHGGDRYVGKFPEDGSGLPDIGAHFLPYDVGNFAFGSGPGLTRAAQELQIYNLNRNVLNAGATPAAQELIAGWYANGTTQDTNYLPPSWAGKGADEVYHKVFAHSCRTCHVNMPERWNFDHFQRVVDDIDRINLSCYREYAGQHRRWGMPNSLVTFNRFWVTKGQPEDLTDLLARFITAQRGDPLTPAPSCELFRIP